ncbi:hypothetical protein D3C75_1090290 [compost metagenome]
MWEALKRQIGQAGLQVVAVDLPVTHAVMKPATEGVEAWLQKAIAQILIQFVASFARKDWEGRRTHQVQ